MNMRLPFGPFILLIILGPIMLGGCGTTRPAVPLDGSAMMAPDAEVDLHRSASKDLDFVRSWIIHLVFERDMSWTFSGPEMKEIERSFQSMSPKHRVEGVRTALTYVDPRYGDRVLQRAWHVAWQLETPTRTQFRKKLRDLMKDSRAKFYPEYRNAVLWSMRAKLAPFQMEKIPEMFDILASWCRTEGEDENSREIRDIGCRHIMGMFHRDYFSGYDVWSEKIRRENYDRITQQEFHSHVLEWLDAHPEARSLIVQWWYRGLESHLEREHHLRHLLNLQEKDPSNDDLRQEIRVMTTRMSHTAWRMEGAKEAIEVLKTEFADELADRRGICSPHMVK